MILNVYVLAALGDCLVLAGVDCTLILSKHSYLLELFASEHASKAREPYGFCCWKTWRDVLGFA